MTVKMPPSKVSELRRALEPLTIEMSSVTPDDRDDYTIELMSIAISLRRIADVMEDKRKAERSGTR